MKNSPKILPQYVEPVSVPKLWYMEGGLANFGNVILSKTTIQTTLPCSLTIKKNFFSPGDLWGVFYAFPPFRFSVTKTKNCSKNEELFCINNFLNKWLSLTATCFFHFGAENRGVQPHSDLTQSLLKLLQP